MERVAGARTARRSIGSAIWVPIGTKIAETRSARRNETRAIERIVMDRSQLPEAQAVLVVQIAKSQNLLFGGTEDYVVTREFARTATRIRAS